MVVCGSANTKTQTLPATDMIHCNDNSTMHEKVVVLGKFSRRKRRLPVRYTRFDFVQGADRKDSKYLYKVHIEDGFLLNTGIGLKLLCIQENLGIQTKRYIDVQADGKKLIHSDWIDLEEQYDEVGKHVRWWFSDQPDPYFPTSIYI